jgi:dTDP-4-dehydrorhamnose reductase
MRRPVLVTGATGQLGAALEQAEWGSMYYPVALDRAALDLADPAAITRVVATGDHGTPWAAIINGAAYTAVDRAEQEQVLAWQTNALAPAAIAQACTAADVPLIQVSTDYVFPGELPPSRKGGWDVDDVTGPLNVYGASKLGGELAVRASGARAVIVRTSWVVSAQGNNFVKTMLRLAAQHQVVRVVADQRGAPTAASDLGATLIHVVRRLADDRDAPTGTYHFSNAGETDWAAFAKEIFRQSAARGGPSARVEPITTADYPTPARRPANSQLSHRAITRDYDINPRAWQSALADILDELIGKPL